MTTFNGPRRLSESKPGSFNRTQAAKTEPVKAEPWVPKKPGPKPKSMAELFEKNTQRDDDGHLIWIGGLAGTGEPRMKYRGIYRHGRQVAYKLVEEDMPWGTYIISDCEKEMCVDSDCLYVAPPEDVVKRCRKFIHPQEGDWAYELNGKQFCRLCSIGVVLLEGPHKAFNRQMEWAGLQDRDRWYPEIMAEIERYPHLIIMAAHETLASYERHCAKTVRDMAAHTLKRLEAVASGDFRTVSGDWDPVSHV